jgi:hypothetical protein
MSYDIEIKKIKEHTRRKPREEDNERKDITITNNICMQRTKEETNKYGKYLKHICLMARYKYVP